MKISKPVKVTGIIFLFLIISAFAWFTAIGGTAYVYALQLEDNWHKENPKTKNDLEQFLHLYSLHQIDPKTSMWGNRYTLQEGERMMQYRILWHKGCPLDVVYDQNNNIKAIFTSYE